MVILNFREGTKNALAYFKSIPFHYSGLIHIGQQPKKDGHIGFL